MGSVELIDVVGGVGTLELPEALAGFSAGMVPAFPRVTPTAAGAARGRGGGGKLPRVSSKCTAALYTGGVSTSDHLVWQLHSIDPYRDALVGQEDLAEQYLVAAVCMETRTDLSQRKGWP